MTTKNNGGPAFPCEGGHNFVVGNEIRRTLPSNGMSLRDYLAAHASDADIQEIMKDNVSDEYLDAERKYIDALGKSKYLMPPFSVEKTYKITRQQARYIHADAMLAAREAQE